MIKLSHTPADGKAMTLAEIAGFIEYCRAHALRGDLVPKVRVNFSGGVKSLEVEGAPVEPEPCPQHPDVLLAPGTPCPKPHNEAD